jgi:molybdate transport system substrate-binding protein
MNKRKHNGIASLTVLWLALHSGPAAAAEINAYISIGMQSVVERLQPDFEKVSGHRIVSSWATAAALNQRLRHGATADLLISTRSGIDGLIAEDRIVAGSDVALASSGVGIAVRKGAPHPDISTPEALRRTLLATRVISYSNPTAGGASGVHFATVLERLGIAEQMKARTKFPPANGRAATLLVSGEVDLAIQQTQELASVDGAEVIGPLPGDLQAITTFVAGIPKSATHAEAARSFLQFLQSPQARAVMKEKGLGRVNVK